MSDAAHVPGAPGPAKAVQDLTRHVARIALQYAGPQGLLDEIRAHLERLGGYLGRPGHPGGTAVLTRGMPVARLCLPDPDAATEAALEDLALLLSPLLEALGLRSLAADLGRVNSWVARQDDPEAALDRVTDFLRTLGTAAGQGAGVQSMDIRLVPHPAPTPLGGLILPLTGRYRARQALQVTPAPDWTLEEQRAAAAATRQLALVTERLSAERRLETLLSLQRQLDSVPAEELYQPLLDAAVQLVPGAQGGSLLVRRGDTFHFGAVSGYDTTPLRNVTFPWQHTRDTWYGLGADAWRRGVPRVLGREGVRHNGVGYDRDGARVEELLPEVEHLQSVVAVPVLFGDEVYALINLDSFTDPDAFDADALRVTQAFGSMASLLIHEAQRHAQIQSAARTDALTGLGNRRAFNETLEQAVQAAAQGDEGLRRVAALLREEVRGSDQLFRWGGDEFAALLPGSDLMQGLEVARRVTQAISALSIGGLPLRATIGVASLRQGGTAETLLQDADAAMYAAKARGEPIAVAGRGEG
ncbi:sensor domain-containing diguanylate cyclase [Deinococcus soli (ex Cha et al. 2016)]|uniref:GGDEF domain-containing protein n=2 Tax=Deinococcus soli (ex Cha et al. 2016) TaxID=1309411 RepID=A0AAE4BR74_9DEIO|nr:sensor domain-containing diguanylate cyclase [Deinococcus soli (ex Cha et al. 2016)]MDR6221496.1 GGDEF domain-containing protein [Deinococcus soli (ex Cha et al. 2016)]MDR6327968.1 GGDEF domain-containing protein [Deinococcus soli (ex Cha et al. 2016)]MDR6750820.1 GGDEF domain-containing protein [Deinococcus soli (ex Cha et al. 2016)]